MYEAKRTVQGGHRWDRRPDLDSLVAGAVPWRDPRETDVDLPFCDFVFDGHLVTKGDMAILTHWYEQKDRGETPVHLPEFTDE